MVAPLAWTRGPSRGLTGQFHEPGLAARLNGENAFTQQHGFWFQLNDQDRQQAKDPSGPSNPQALNRYSYVLENPLRYTDPTGHFFPLIIFGVVISAEVVLAFIAADISITAFVVWMQDPAHRASLNQAL